MGVGALGSGTSVIPKYTESSGPEVAGKFALWTTLPTGFKVKGISRYNSQVRNSFKNVLKLFKARVSLKMFFVELTFCIKN